MIPAEISEATRGTNAALDQVRRPRFVQNLATVFGAQLGCGLMSLTLEIVYARLLGPVGRGQISLCLMAIAAAVVVGSAGGEIPITIWSADAKRASFQWLSASYTWAFLGSLLSCTLWAGIYWVWQPAFLQGLNSTLAIFVLLTIPVSICFAYGLALITGRERFAQRASVLLTDQSATLIFGVMLIVFIRRSAEMGVLANLLGFTIGICAEAYLLRFVLRGTWNFRSARENLPAALSLGMRAQLGNLATFFNYRLDVFIVNYFLNPGQVGLYAVGVLVSETLWQLPHAAAVSILPRTARTGDSDSVKFTCAVLRHVLLIACASGAAMALLSPWVIPLVFGAQFRPSVPVIWWILPGTVALAVGKVMAADLTARGRPEYSSIFAIMALGVTVVLDLALIPRMGIEGAALASSAAYFLDALLLAMALKRVLQVRWVTLLLPSTSDAALYYQVWQRFRGLAAA